ncbi:hypothetical protein FCL47_05100 [Desulfopila sp. IMCC35006]|uniref:hypothetical protein n=1 Tax=Desulfopila sp. IMCC35006 TaxID=2569542 RepID=UPI0010ACDDE7|nr:hypothetical protein [Desulfopila sp. IMCC35006]TKB27515.1 hypothetical protein FCL47_05100 [Desulfopila sp. IMCC35006]
MIRGWYHSIKNGQRLLAIDEIAEGCCVSRQEAKRWFADKIRQPGPAGNELVDAAEVVWFLVKNSMPVATSLLPPKTKKILFVANEESEFHDKCEKFDRMCHVLATNCNILVETSTAGKAADLSLLTFSPDLVVIFVKSCSRETINTFHLLTNFPEQKMILFIDESIKTDFERELGKLPAPHLIVGDTLPIDEVLPNLSRVFDN